VSIPNDGRRYVRPSHPGEHLREDFLPGEGFTVASFAEAIGVSRQTVNELLNERRAVSADMALRLGRLFSQSPQFWLGLQQSVDLWDAQQSIKAELARIKPLPVPPILTEEEARSPGPARVSESKPGRKAPTRRAR
jgi:addiction module HigA family antidote